MIIDKYTLVVFDLDGTLVHTKAEYRYLLVPKVLKHLGKNPRIDLRLIDKFWFDGNRNTTIQNDFGCDPMIFWRTIHKVDDMKERDKYTYVYNDVHEAIYMLAKIGKVLAITTGAAKKLANFEADLLPRELFTTITPIRSSHYKDKPHPGSLLGCLKLCKANLNEAVYIGNSSEDCEYSANAGVDFIYLDRSEHDFKGGSVSTIHTLLELFLK